MGEFLMDLWSFMKERKNSASFQLSSACSARRIDSSHFRIGSCAVHLHSILEWSAGVSRNNSLQNDRLALDCRRCRCCCLRHRNAIIPR
jgi:hypothetical protein